ncbi:PAS domain-containing protein [candidate division WOR-3 bacterium]|nr:PAS domain-containing protein [candidate division WOR-3 bacterium]
MTIKVFNDVQREERIQTLLKAAEDAQLLSTKILSEKPLSDEDSLFKGIFGGQDFRYSLYGPDGELLADSKVQKDSFPGRTSESVFFQGLIAASDKEDKKFGYIEKEYSSSLSLPIILSGNLLGVMVVEGSVETQKLENTKYIILIFLAVLMFFSLFSIAGSNSDILKTFDSIKRLIERAAENERGIILSEKEIALLGEERLKISDLLSGRRNEKKDYIEVLGKIIEILPSYAMAIDTSGKIVLCNSAAEKFFSKDPSEKITGTYYREVFGKEELFNMISQADKTDSSLNAEMEINGLYCDTTVDKVSFDGMKLFLLIAHDISERIKTKERQNRFIVSTAHELKTPLSIINGFFEILEGESEENKKKFFSIIKNNLVRLNNLVSDLLLLTKTDDPGFLYDFGKTDLKFIAQEMVAAFEQKAKSKQIEFKTSFPEDEAFVFGDNFLLGQMIMNLVDNAVKYNKNGGEVTISIEKRNGLVVLAVKDTGIGIPEKYSKEIFSRFFTIDKSRSREAGGTGLGLSIVKNIADRHSAYVNFESEKGEGTTFFVSFPELKN